MFYQREDQPWSGEDESMTPEPPSDNPDGCGLILTVDEEPSMFRQDMSDLVILTGTTDKEVRYKCRVSGVPSGRECSENFGGSAILAVRPSLTGSRGEYLRVVGIHSDG